MAKVVTINNPFDPLKDYTVDDVAAGKTIWEWLTQKFQGFTEFARPTYCLVNGRPLLRAGWREYVIKETDVVSFVPLQQGPVLFVVFAIITAVSVAIALSVPKPATPGQQPEPDPVYDLKGQNNQIRLGNPIEVPYGRNRLFPSYAARSYTKYINNDQYLYQLFCLGQGEYDIEAVRIEDTAIASFADVVYEVYAPGDSVDLFPDNVVTSVEVAGIELKGTNEVGYGMSGPFVANPSGTDTDHLEIDVSLPGGLYLGNSKGGLDNLTVTALFEYREIDDAGAPIGSWTTLSSFTKTLRTNTPQRFTLEATVTPGRYEVRGQRTNTKNEDTKAQSLLRWDGLRAFLPSTKDYGDVTLLAIKARASNNLNDRSSNRVNVIATRKLEIWNGTVWSAPTATRNPLWAMCDVFRANYGGRVDDAYLRLSELLTAATAAGTRSDTFDFVFEQNITVWEAAKTVARLCRSVPMLNGSQITIVRDEPKTVPIAAFNKETIIAGSFKWEVKLPGLDEYDGLEIFYIDPDTFTEESVQCLLDGEAGNNCEKVKLYGCTSRTKAYREGLYMRAVRKRRRENVVFSTGLEGHLPSYLSPIFVTHDAPKVWGQGGLVTAIAVDNVTITLSDEVTFGVGTHKIAFRKKDGTVSGPHTCTAGATANEVVLGSAIDPSLFYFGLVHERPGFYFGPEGAEAAFCSVVNLRPGSDGSVEVVAVVYKDVYDNDEEDPPSLPSVPMPPKPPAAPELDCGNLVFSRVQTNGRRGMLSWMPTLGVTEYRVEVSTNNTDWTLAGVTSALFMEIDVEPGQPVYARVQPVGAGSTDWCELTDVVAPEEPEVPSIRYEDLFLVQVTPATTEYYCRTRGGTATLVGKNEFDGFVTTSAPKRFRRVDVSGGGSSDVYSASDCATYTGNVATAFSGNYTWNALTGATTNATVAQPYVDGVAGTPTTVSITQTSPIDTPVCDFDRVYTQKSRTVIGNQDCCPSTGSNYVKSSGTWRQVLSDEDTEEDAIARVIAGLIASPPSADPDGWSDFGLCNGDGTLPCCTSEWALRPSSYSFDYNEAEFQINATGLNAAGFSVVVVKIKRVDLSTMEEEDAEEQVFETYADGGGEISFEVLLPVARGFQHFVHEVRYYSLVEGLDPIP